MRNLNHWVAPFIVGISLWPQSGCGSSKPARYYLLSALSPAERASKVQGLTVGIGPIEFPEYLDRPQIVTRGSQNRLYLADFDRWAEPLELNFKRMLVENLAVLLATDEVVQFPWKRSRRIDYQILVTVIRFDAAQGGDMVLNVRWTVSDGDGRSVIPPRVSRITKPAESADYEAIVQAGSRALEEMSRRIAAAVQKIKLIPASEGSD